MTIYDELSIRLKLCTFRLNSGDPALVESGEKGMEELLHITSCLDEHPESEDGEMWDGPCECADCLSCGEP